jgi:hypothetical protein
VAQIKAMYARGVSIRSIANHFLVSRFAIRYHLFPEVRRRSIEEANSKPDTRSKEEKARLFRNYYARKKAYLLKTYGKEN